MKHSIYIGGGIIFAWLTIGLTFYIYNYDLIDNTLRSLSRAVHHIELPFDQVDSTYTPKALRKKLTKPGLICFKEASNLGDFSCSAHIRSFAKVDLLNWKHEPGKKLLFKLYGQPSIEEKSLEEIVPAIRGSLQGALINIAERALADARLIEWKSATGIYITMQIAL